MKVHAWFFPCRHRTQEGQAVILMSTERHPEMNSGDRPKYFDRGSRLCYRRPWRRPGADRSLFQTLAGMPAHLGQSLAQFVTVPALLGKPFCATWPGDAVIDLSACLFPGSWSSEKLRRGFPSLSRVRMLYHPRRGRLAGFQGAGHKSARPTDASDRTAEPTETLSVVRGPSDLGADRDGPCEQVPAPDSLIQPDVTPASGQSLPPLPVDPWLTRPHTPPQRVADTRRQPMRLSALFDEFSHFLRVEEGATPATIATYRWCFGDFLAFVMKQVGGTAVLTHFTEVTCRSYQYDLANRELKTGTIRLRVATLGSFGKWMVRRDKVVRNPVDRLTRPRRKARVPAVPAWPAVEALLGSCTLRERAMLALMAFGGLRRGEVVALDVGDVVFDFGLRRVMGKGGPEVPVALPAGSGTSNPPRLCGGRAGWCAHQGSVVRGHLHEHGSPINGAADHRSENLEDCSRRREASRPTGVASARPSARVRRGVAAPNQEPSPGAGTAAPRGRANNHRLHEDHPAGYSGRIGNAR